MVHTKFSNVLQHFLPFNWVTVKTQFQSNASNQPTSSPLHLQLSRPGEAALLQSQFSNLQHLQQHPPPQLSKSSSSLLQSEDPLESKPNIAKSISLSIGLEIWGGPV